LSAPLRNLELKARDAHPRGSLDLALALGAEDRGEIEQRDNRGEIEQRDTYFARARGRLKLREQEPGGAELIAYDRSDVREPSPSAYRVVPVAEPEALREALVGEPRPLAFDLEPPRS
jgi:adenylate cyclase, class 2